MYRALRARLKFASRAPRATAKILKSVDLYTPAGVLFRLARRPVPRPEGGGFVVVDVGEGASRALGHRVGVRNPGQGPAGKSPRSPRSGGEATPPITGGWDHGWFGWSGSLAVSRHELLGAEALPTRSVVPTELSTMWYGSEGLHQAVAPAIGV